MSDPVAKLTTALADRYRIERSSGAGGMATVYLAHDVRHDRRVALKVLRPELSALRDIMDSAQTTVDDWRGRGIYEAMEELYHEIWVYGCRDFYDPIIEYQMPSSLAAKTYFTGYIPRHIPSPEDVKAVRSELGLRDEEKMVLLTTGGGGDGYPVLNTFLEALEENPVPDRTRIVIVTGPFISSRVFPDVAARCRKSGFIALKFHRYMEALIGASSVIVSMGGYNTICDIISQHKPFLIVPRTVPREEQLIRAQVLCRRGLCD